MNWGILCLESFIVREDLRISQETMATAAFSNFDLNEGKNNSSLCKHLPTKFAQSKLFSLHSLHKRKR